MPGRRGASGAIVAQFSQAVGSFALHVLASRFLGTSGLAQFALIYGFVVVATGVVTGLVGDSLTVLDRADPHIRSALQTWLALVAVLVIVVFAIGAVAGADEALARAVLIGVTGAAFVLEDTLRRMLMASIRFWSLVVVDTTAAVIAVGTVVGVQLTSTATLSTFLIALTTGQVVASVVAVGVMPRAERWIARATPAMRAVWQYGAWRAMQQFLRPAALSAVRIAVILAASSAAYGELEAARLFVAPAMLIVGGVASYLFASYARDRERPLAELTRRADRSVVVLLVITLAGGAVATAIAPYAAELLLGSSDPPTRLAVFGWVAFAAATAAVTPYGSLAAVRGRQAAVFFVRVAETVATVVAVVLGLAADLDVDAVPCVLAVVSACAGVTMRVLLVRTGEPGAEPDRPDERSDAIS